MKARSFLFWFGLLGFAACGPVEVGKLTVLLKRGSVDPLNDPGDATRPGRPVAALRLRWDGPLLRWPADAGVTTTPVIAGQRLTLSIPAPAAAARLTVATLLTGTDEVWALGRSLRVDPPKDGTTTEVPVLLGPVDAWTVVGEALAGQRRGAQLAALGEGGALVVGGVDTLADGGSRPSEPAVLRFELNSASFTPVDGLPSTGPVALGLKSGAVLHGLGQLADGGLSASLTLTDAAGTSRPVSINGAALEPRADAAALALRDGSVLLLGGRGASGPLASVLRLTLDEASAQATVDLLPPLATPRSRMVAAQLSTGEVFGAGGEGAGNVVLDDGFWLDLASTTPAWRSANNRMVAPRAGALAVRLEDDSVLIWGGGPDSGDVFSLVASTDGGFLRLAVGVTGLHQADVLRVGRSVLFVGGEQGAEPPFAARFVPSVQTPALGQQYAGTWTRLGATVETRRRTGLVVLGTDAVLTVGGGASRAELFTPSDALLAGD